jgi:hypothetical protein
MELNYFYILFFFTMWNVILVLFHKYTHKYFELLYLSFVTFIMGLYFSTVNPRKYTIYFGDKTIVINKWYLLLLIDLTFHFGVFLFIYFKYYKYYKSVDTNMLLLSSVLLLIIYICMISPSKVYGVNFIEILTTITIVTLFYFIIF